MKDFWSVMSAGNLAVFFGIIIAGIIVTWYTAYQYYDGVVSGHLADEKNEQLRIKQEKIIELQNESLNFYTGTVSPVLKLGILDKNHNYIELHNMSNYPIHDLNLEFYYPDLIRKKCPPKSINGRLIYDEECLKTTSVTYTRTFNIPPQSAIVLTEMPLVVGQGINNLEVKIITRKTRELLQLVVMKQGDKITSQCRTYELDSKGHKLIRTDINQLELPENYWNQHFYPIQSGLIVNPNHTEKLL
ncbi:hypothetical protein AAEO56_05090 [Flavobacterium sp. DGU11]|uniref:Uncharacterized protein n=1 Tax=Flavobacterium arundinis TaxID=3139143 RepID=A0ABU9HUG1_9FLAO